MKKAFRLVLISIAVLYVLYSVLGLTGMLKMYNTPTTANEPGIKLNSKFFVSNLITYEKGDFVCYTFQDQILGEHIRVHRLMGTSGDTILIKDGILYINDNNVSENMELKYSYIIDSTEFQNLVDQNVIKQDDISFRTADLVYVFLSSKDAHKYGLSSKIHLESTNQTDKMILEKYNKNWNRDNFGPLVISKGKCFVIGDNRHNSQDSRYNGLIDEEDIVGTVVR